MTVPAPSLETALSALVAAITTQAALLSTTDETVLVTEGPPSQNQPDDLVVVGEQMEEQFTPHALVGGGGQGFLHEDYRISVVVDVYRGGADFPATRTRCTSLVNAVHTAVRNDPSLAGTVYLAYPLSNRYEQAWENDGKGTRVRCEIEIRCQSLN